jgi:hypothetical protein
LGPVGIEREQGPGRRRPSTRVREGGGGGAHEQERKWGGGRIQRKVRCQSPPIFSVVVFGLCWSDYSRSAPIFALAGGNTIAVGDSLIAVSS